MPISYINNNSLASGVPGTSKLPAGSVLQMVQTTTQTPFSTSSGSAISTGFLATITPTSSGTYTA